MAALLGRIQDSPLRVLKDQNYRLYFLGQLVSMSGSWMQSIAQSWLVYRLSGSGYWLGLISFCSQIPAFLLSPVAGVIADRFDRRRILVAVQAFSALQALVLAGLLFWGTVQLWQIAALAICLGVVNAFENTTRHSFAIDMVGKQELPSAIALNSVVMNVSRILGPSVAGFMIGAVGEAWCFLINGLSYFPVMVGLVRMRLKRAAAVELTQPNKGMLHHMVEGWRYARHSEPIIQLLILSSFVCFVGSPFFILLPMFAKEILGGDAHTLALLTGTVGVGAVLGALLTAGRESGHDLWWRLGRYTAFWGIGMILLGASNVLGFSLLAVFVAGFFMMSLFPALNSSLQYIVEDRMRGRVLSLYTMTFLGGMPLGSLVFGWAADRVGAPVVTATAGAVMLVMGVFVLIRRRNGTDKTARGKKQDLARE